MNSKFIKVTDPNEIRKIILNSSENPMRYAIANFWNDRNEKLLYNTETGEYFLNSFFPGFPSEAWERFLQALERINTRKRQLYQVDVVITGKCHCNCWHCYRIKHCRDDLSVDTVRRVLNESYQLGVATIGITGGEPMIHSDIYQIIDAVPDGIRAQIYTTGHLVTKEFCQKLKQSNVDRMIISLDFHKAEVVEKTRHYKNAFKETIEAVELLVKNGIYTVLTICMLPEFTTTDMEEYFEFVKKLHVQEIRVVMPIPQGNIEGGIAFDYIGAKKMMHRIRDRYLEEEEAPIIVLFSEFESAFCFGCSAGAGYLSVNNDGEVTPCVAVPLSFGSIYDNTLTEIYKYMEKYFKNTGCTCYGRKAGRIMDKLNVNTKRTPLSQEDSKRVASEYVVSGKSAVFFEKYVLSIKKDDSERKLESDQKIFVSEGGKKRE